MFVIGQEYLRDQLLNFVGSGQIQSGIIWGKIEPDCLIVTSGGKHGIEAGYEDKRNPDGSWDYYGQGEKGDHDPQKFSNKLLIDKVRTVLLFSTREPFGVEKKRNNSFKKFYRFEGIFEVVHYEIFIPISGKRQGDKLLKFLLVQAENIFEITASDELPQAAGSISSLRDLRKQIIQNVKQDSKGIQTVKEYRKRSLLTKLYALTRANGSCELCNKVAPFYTALEIPFLEVHHILRLADDGPDLPENVSALCPNCHKEAHFGMNKLAIKESLIKSVSRKEASIF